MNSLTEMPNISTVNAEKLTRAGIDTPQKLLELGSKEAFTRVRLYADSGACIQMLYGLEGAIRGMRGYRLPDEVKTELKAFYATFK